VATELGETGVRVHSISAVAIATGIFRQAFGTFERGAKQLIMSGLGQA